MTDQRQSFSLELTDSQAWALAQFVKRVGWSEMRACAEDDDEARAIRDAVSVLSVALKVGGYAPR
jgi:hypothetical protein